MLEFFVKIFFVFLMMTSLLVASMPSFEEAMSKDYDPARWRTAKRFKIFYDSYYAKEKPLVEKKIPKIIHQIWLGGPVPEKFYSLMESWKRLHPTWEYRLWTDKDVESFDLTCERPFKEMENLGGRSDILRYEILYLYGGVYVDCDFECLRSLDSLVDTHMFFAGLADQDYVNNAIIGTAPKHPLMQRLLKFLNFAPPNLLKSPWYHTGPKFFTFHVYQYLKEHPNEGVIYPTLFFYPLPNSYRFDYREGKLPKEKLDQFIAPYSFGIHYWEESWR